MPVPNDNHSHPGQVAWTEDTIYRHTLREAKIILILWSVALVYTCTYCYLNGYESHPSDPSATGPAVSSWFGPLESFDRDPTLLTTPLGLGIPDWVFYGVVLPWLACIVATFWFCLFVYHEDELGNEEENWLDAGPSAGKGDAVHG
jgi:hypothetical protein